jgi:sterol desaturase/sphingolipid hydroxylase (fatty acid hydroxylase superfamily)
VALAERCIDDRGPLRHALNSARYHARHHAGGRGNYGLVTPWLDRLFGTEIAQYRCGQGASRADALDTSKHTLASR